VNNPAGAAAVVGCHSSAHVVCIERAAGGHEVHVVVGQTVRVFLSGADLGWSGLHQTDPPLLRRNGAIGHRSGGLAASYTAIKEGHTSLRASGAPKCFKQQACPQFILVWQVRIEVT
jgi:hypothetical protein